MLQLYGNSLAGSTTYRLTECTLSDPWQIISLFAVFRFDPREQPGERSERAGPRGSSVDHPGMAVLLPRPLPPHPFTAGLSRGGLSIEAPVSEAPFFSEAIFEAGEKR